MAWLSVTARSPPPPLVVSPVNGTLPGATANVLYSETLTASGGIPPYKNWTGTSLPAWMTLTDIGGGQATLTGTPLGAESDSFSVSVQDFNGNNGQILFQ